VTVPRTLEGSSTEGCTNRLLLLFSSATLTVALFVRRRLDSAMLLLWCVASRPPPGSDVDAEVAMKERGSVAVNSFGSPSSSLLAVGTNGHSADDTYDRLQCTASCYNTTDLTTNQHLPKHPLSRPLRRPRCQTSPRSTRQPQLLRPLPRLQRLVLLLRSLDPHAEYRAVKHKYLGSPRRQHRFRRKESLRCRGYEEG
jgi:hypothetical protein